MTFATFQGAKKKEKQNEELLSFFLSLFPHFYIVLSLSLSLHGF